MWRPWKRRSTKSCVATSHCERPSATWMDSRYKSLLRNCGCRYRLTVVTGSGESEQREAELQRLTREAAVQPFDLARGPLFRASLLRVDEQRPRPDDRRAPHRRRRLVGEPDRREVGGTLRSVCARPSVTFAGPDDSVRRLCCMAAPVVAGRNPRATGRVLAEPTCRRTPSARIADRPAASGECRATAATSGLT